MEEENNYNDFGVFDEGKTVQEQADLVLARIKEFESVGEIPHNDEDYVKGGRYTQEEIEKMANFLNMIDDKLSDEEIEKSEDVDGKISDKGKNISPEKDDAEKARVYDELMNAVAWGKVLIDDAYLDPILSAYDSFEPEDAEATLKRTSEIRGVLENPLYYEKLDNKKVFKVLGRVQQAEAIIKERFRRIWDDAERAKEKLRNRL